MNITTQRSIKERILHAFFFEFFAILFTMLIGIFILNKPLASMGIISVFISLTALILNIVFNWLFDLVFPFIDGYRPIKIRLLHALGFETTLIIFAIPMIAYFLQVSLLEALMIEAVLLIFFLFYTYGYNWGYDQIRQRIMTKLSN